MFRNMSSCYMCKTSCASKVIIHKSRGEVSLVEQETIECVSYPIKKITIVFLLYHIQLFSADATKRKFEKKCL